jgi:hypothetical protein
MANTNVIAEEPWNDRIEHYMREFIQTAKKRNAQHESAGYHFKRLNTRWGLPLVLVPVIMSPVSLLIDGVDGGEYVQAAAFMLSGVIAGVYSFFRYGEKLEKHFGFAGRYGDVATDIEAILVRSREFRGPADVFSTKIKMVMDNLAITEPTLPRFILDDPNYKVTTEAVHDYKSVNQSDLPV